MPLNRLLIYTRDVEAHAGGLAGLHGARANMASQFGGDGVTPKDAETVARHLAVKPEMRVAAKAGHFAFLTPCGAELAKAAADFGEAEICTDAGGFDRVAFHRQFNAEVRAFFERHLGAAPRP